MTTQQYETMRARMASDLSKLLEALLEHSENLPKAPAHVRYKRTFWQWLRRRPAPQMTVRGVSVDVIGLSTSSHLVVYRRKVSQKDGGTLTFIAVKHSGDWYEEYTPFDYVINEITDDGFRSEIAARHAFETTYQRLSGLLPPEHYLHIRGKALGRLPI